MGLSESIVFTKYCKTINISAPLMLVKLAMQYHLLLFMGHVVRKMKNCVLPVQQVAETKTDVLLLPSCDDKMY